MRISLLYCKMLVLMSMLFVGGMASDVFAGNPVEVGKYYNIITGSTREYAKNQPIYVAERNSWMHLGTYDLENNDPTKDTYAIWVFEEFDGGYAIKNVQTNQYMGAYKGDGFENVPVMQSTPVCYNVAVYDEDMSMVTLCQKGCSSKLKADQSNQAVLNYPEAGDKQHGWILKEVPAACAVPEAGKYFNIITGSIRDYAKNQPIYVTEAGDYMHLGTYDLILKNPVLDPYAVWTFEEMDGGYAVKNVQTGQYMGAYKGDSFEDKPIMSDEPVCYVWGVYADDATMITLVQKGCTSYLKADKSNMAVLNYFEAGDKQQGWMLRQVDPVEPVQEGELEIKEGYYNFISAYGKFESSGNNDYKRGLFCTADSSLEWAVYTDERRAIDNSQNPAYVWHVTKNENGTYYMQNVLTGCYIGSPSDKNQLIPMVTEPIELTINSLGNDQWDIVAYEWHKKAVETKDKDAYENEAYTFYADSGNNSAGPIGGWYSGKNDRGAWYVKAITDEEMISAIKAAAVQDQNTHKIKLAVDEARKVYFKLYGFKTNMTGLLTEADDFDDEHNQFWGTYQDAEYSRYAHLIDGDQNTCFQSSWSPAIEQPQWLQVDLRDKPVKDFTFYFGLRNDSNWGPKEMWSDVTIYATNDENLTHSESLRSIEEVAANPGWVKIGDFADIPLDCAMHYQADSGWYYDVVGLMGEKYRFIRFYVNSTYSRQASNMYTIGEFQVYENTPNEETAPINTIDGLKAVGEEFLAKFEECKKALAAGNGTEVLAREMRALSAQVWEMMPNMEGLEELSNEVETFLSKFEEGDTNIGDIPTEYWEAAQTALEAARNYPAGVSATEVEALRTNLQKAYADCKANMKKIDPSKWYFFVNQARNAAGEKAVSFGSVLYMESGNSEEKHWSDIEALKWGYCTDGVEEYTTKVNPYTMWRLVPIDEANDIYAIQNRASGRYIDYLYPGIREGVSDRLIPYKAVYMKSGQVNFICQDYRNTSGGGIYARPNPQNGYHFIGGEVGGEDSPCAWNLEEVLDEDYGFLNLYFNSNSINIVSFPFALDDTDLTEMNEEEGWTMYGVKYYHPEDLTLGLVKKTVVEAGEPFILVQGDCQDETALHEEMSFAIPCVNEYTKEEKVANGLHAILDYKKDQTGMCYFENGVVTEVKSSSTGFDAFTGVLDLKAVVDPNPEVEADLVLQTPADYSLVRALNFQKGGLINVFTIDGKLVKKNVKSSNATENLDKGIYVVGNKKVSVK